MSLTDFSEQSRVNPLDVVERVATTNSWSFERAGDDEITILVTGKWTDYQVSYTWMFDIEALHLACAFELKVPERNSGEVQQLISLINEQMWVGHFDLWTQDGIVMYRHALVLAGGVEASSRQCEALLGTALDASTPPARTSAWRYITMPSWVHRSKWPTHICSLISEINCCTSPRQRSGTFSSKAQARCSASMSYIQV